MNPSLIEIVASTLFALAICHTFLVSKFQEIAARFENGSVGENLFHLLGEVEVVFGLWAGLFIAAYAVILGPSASVQYAESLNFTEPLFVFAIMTVAATKPVVELAKKLIFGIAALVPINKEVGAYFSCLTIGPLLGSLITEPASMTVTALILRDRFFVPGASSRLKYFTIAALFVNVSIGGVLTHFAAPPVLMVAGKWGWGLSHMLSEFGWKATIAVVLNALLAVVVLRRELFAKLSAVTDAKTLTDPPNAPYWLIVTHIFFLGMVVLTAHHPVIFIGLLLFFLGVAAVTSEHQEPLKLRESLLVSFFLAGLVVLGSPQKWWLQPIIAGLDDLSLFLSAAGLTAFTDNAALTFLGSQIETINDAQKYALVAGAVAAGGLTVIANAPNPAGYAILQDRFGEDGIQPIKLLLFALGPTLIAIGCFWFL